MKTPCLQLLLWTAILFGSGHAHAQWKKLPGPTGGNVTAFHVNGDDVYAAIMGGFLYYAGDYTLTWQQITSPAQSSTVSCFATSDNYLYAGMDAGLFRSDDKGLTWVDVNAGLPNWIYNTPVIRSLAVVDGVLLAGTSAGICRSTDDGATWSVPGDEFFDVWIDDLSVAGDVAYAVYNNAVHRSYDRGDTWHTVGGGIVKAPVDFVAADGSVLVCGSGGNNVFRSYDDGNTWKVVGNQNSEWRFRDLVVHDSKIWACSGENIYRLSVIETEWLDKCKHPDAKNCYVLAFQGNSLLGGTGQEGIFRGLNDGASWERKSDGLYAAQITSMCAAGDTVFAGMGTSGIFRSTNGGDDWTWRDANVNIQQVFISFARRGSNVFAGATRSGISISNDNGDSWRWHVSMLDPEVFQVQQILVNGNDIWAVSFGAVYKSTDDGFSWAEYKTGLPNVQITSICLLDNFIFVGTRGFGVYRSSDNGATWVAGKYPMNERRIARMISHGGMLFAGTIRDGDDGTTYRSSDSGVTWKALRSGLPRDECTAFVVADTFLYISLRDSGLYSSTNLGAEWMDANATLTYASITDLSVSDTHLYAATRGDGIWKRPLNELPTTVEHDRALSAQSLSVHPSITNADVTIEFTIPRPGSVLLNVYNIQGECVATIVSAILDAGEHSFEWNALVLSNDPSVVTAGARFLPGGLYYVRLQCENSVQSKPLFFIR